MSDFLYGSLCLSDIPRELIKEVTLKNGEKKKFLSISVSRRKEARSFDGGKTTYTHFVSCSPRKEERREGVNYFIGDLREWNDQPQGFAPPTPEEIAAAPAAAVDELPF